MPLSCKGQNAPLTSPQSVQLPVFGLYTILLLTNIVWCIAYTREVGGGVLYIRVASE